MNVLVVVECFALLMQSLVTISVLYPPTTCVNLHSRGYLFSSHSELIVLVHSIGQLILSTSLALGYFTYALWWDSTVFKVILTVGSLIAIGHLAQLFPYQKVHTVSLTRIFCTIFGKVCYCRRRACYFVCIWHSRAASTQYKSLIQAGVV